MNTTVRNLIDDLNMRVRKRRVGLWRVCVKIDIAGIKHHTNNSTVSHKL